MTQHAKMNQIDTDNQADSTTTTSKKMEESSNSYSESTSLLKQQDSEPGGTTYASDGETTVSSVLHEAVNCERDYFDIVSVLTVNFVLVVG